jgi:aspartate-semialdehyde dehydrogenase
MTVSSSETRALTVAVYGAMSPLAQELRRQLEGMSIPVAKMRLFEAAGQEGTLSEFAGEAMVVAVPDEDEASRADLSFLCSEDDPRSVHYLDWIARGQGVAVDMIGATRQRADVPVVNCDVNPQLVQSGLRVAAVPHPMAHPLSTILHRLRDSFSLRDCCATVFRPASDHGKKGVEELHQQTLSVLNFSTGPREVFGRQMAFNLFPLAVQGEGGAALETIVREDVLKVLDDPHAPVSLRILQVPIFYGHCYSIRVRLEDEPSPDDVRAALDHPEVIRVSEADNQRTPAEIGAESGIWIADIRRDPAGQGACWLWAITDGIRSGAALNAARLAERLMGIGA